MKKIYLNAVVLMTIGILTACGGTGENETEPDVQPDKNLEIEPESDTEDSTIEMDE